MCRSVEDCQCNSNGCCCKCCQECHDERLRYMHTSILPQDFLAESLTFARSIKSFHERLPCELSDLHKRLKIVQSEMEEAKLEADALLSGGDELNYRLFLEEMADVSFLALGTLELAGEEGRRALRIVTRKNNAKTPETHYKDPKEGKWVRR